MQAPVVSIYTFCLFALKVIKLLLFTSTKMVTDMPDFTKIRWCSIWSKKIS
jgi:hypothetical protein